MIGLTITLGIVFIGWMIYTAWSAPLMRENKDGSWTTIKPERKVSELFTKRKVLNKNKKTSGSYFDLEKYKRGRSKH